MMQRVPLALSLGALGFLGYLGAHGVDAVQLRMDEIERSSLTESRIVNGLERDLKETRQALEDVTLELEASRAELLEAQGLVARLGETEGALSHLGVTLEEQAERIDLVAQVQETFDPDTLEGNLRDLSERWDRTYTMAASAAELAGESQVRLAELDRRLGLDRDRESMWDTLVGPVVQLAGEDSVGSGIVVRGQAIEDRSREVDYVLTAWHVVRDIQGSLYNRDMPVPVSIYRDETTIRPETATLLVFDTEIDVAVLRLDTEERVDNFARLGRPSRLRAIEIFDRVYAVGCPLGNDPIPTIGEIAATRHEVDGETYIMISAPTYVGNSGGGIFDADTQELLGVFSKVYTHGSLRPTIVTHMGLVTPLDVIYDWLETTEYGFLSPTASETASAAADR
jgi:S1-C subfamily serine protease